MRIPHFRYHAPKTLEELAEVLQETEGVSAVLGGGTELLVRMKQRIVCPGHLIALSGVEGLDAIATDEAGAIRIGASARLASLAGSPLLRESFPVLPAAASLVGSQQVRNMATVGGNLFQDTRCVYYNRSSQWRRAVTPCVKRGGDRCHVVPQARRCFAVYQGDLAPVLIALDATAVLLSSQGFRELPVEELFTGDGKEPIRVDGRSVLVAVKIPSPAGHLYGAYRKFRLRGGVDFPLAGVALVVIREGGFIRRLAICLTGGSSGPVMVTEAATPAAGKELTPSMIRDIAEIVRKAAHPVANLEDTPAHRRSMIVLLTEEMLSEAAKDA
jgi:4-hydroxybenzoyl-CoA reductase subunit beta